MHRFAIALTLLAIHALAAADTINVDVRNNFFLVTSPVPGEGTNAATIRPGDTVIWTWFGNFHSVTEENGLFDSGVHNMPFTFSFTFEDAGTYIYFCSVHGAHMDGTIVVICPEDLNSDGQVDISDLALLLSNFGRSDNPTAAEGDINASGTVDLTDLAILLSAFGLPC